MLLMPGARTIATVCANVQAGEAVLVVTDYLLSGLAEVVAAACHEQGGETMVCVTPPRRIDNEEPRASVAAAMKAAQVLILPVTKSLSHTRAVREAVGGGARALSMAAFTPELLRSPAMQVDFRAQQPTCRAVAQALTDGEHAELTTPGGTMLGLSLKGRKGNAHGCIVGPGQFSAVPNIEANIAPVEGSAEGVIVADASIPYYGIGVLRQPVRFLVRRGFVTDITGGVQAAFIRDLLAAQDDPFVYNIAQLAVGLNPNCREMTGVMLNDEGVHGTVHIGIGTSASLGGTAQAKTHFDALMWRPTLTIDGHVILRDGILSI